MNLNDALAEGSLFLPPQDVIYLDGAVAEDEIDDYFRIFPDPRDKTKYYRLKKEHVIGELHAYSQDDMKANGLAPFLGFTPHNEYQMFQIPVKFGVELDAVTIKKAQAGKHYPKEFGAIYDKKSSGCSCKGNHKSHSQKPDKAELFRYCAFRSPCSSGCALCDSWGDDCSCNGCSDC
ncbi:hypothetical protein ACEPP6_19405 [Bacillus rugosus]|uniref:hypothetical protein n=1 Tax=Bacillus rugosus TaxID=2715209 RepID=UPI0035A3735D